MKDIVIPDIAKEKDGILSLLQERFNIRGNKCGDDVVIDGHEASRCFGKHKFIRLQELLPLDDSTNDKVSQKMQWYVSEAMDNIIHPPHEDPVTIQGGFGIISSIDEITTKLAMTRRQHILPILSNELLPFMKERLNSCCVTTVYVNENDALGFISLSKMSLLVCRYGISKAQELRADREPFGSILPDCYSLLSYFDALTRFSPITLSLPVRYRNCSWHFLGQGMRFFTSAAANGMVQLFMYPSNPLSQETSMFGLGGLNGMDENSIWSFMRLIANGLNELFSYLRDLRNFASTEGRVNLMHQIQAISAINLLFADIEAMNFSSSPHHRISFSFSAMDKFANLRVALGGQSRKEDEEMRLLCSFSQSKNLQSIISVACEKYLYSDLAETLSDAVAICYKETHKALAEQCGNDNTSETIRLNRLRSQRNVRHGAFLNRNQFEELFVSSHGSVPSSIVSLPFYLMLGLMFDPKQFLSFVPTIDS